MSSAYLLIYKLLFLEYEGIFLNIKLPVINTQFKIESVQTYTTLVLKCIFNMHISADIFTEGRECTRIFRAFKATDKVTGLANEVSNNSHLPAQIIDLEKQLLLSTQSML